MLCIRSLVVKQGSYFTSISLSDPPTIVLLCSGVQFTYRCSETPSESLFRAQYALRIALWIADIPLLSA